MRCVIRLNSEGKTIAAFAFVPLALVAPGRRVAIHSVHVGATNFVWDGLDANIFEASQLLFAKHNIVQPGQVFEVRHSRSGLELVGEEPAKLFLIVEMVR